MASATEILLRMLDERGLSYQTHYLNVSWRVGSKLYVATDILDGTLTVTNLTPEQAVAATLGGEECELVETESYSNANEVVHVLECSVCGETCEHTNGSYPRCPHCGRKAVE